MICCLNCGFEIQDGDAFCASCGYAIQPQQQNFQHQDLCGGMQTNSFVPSSEEVAAAESKSVASLILGIISLATCGFVVGIVLAALAISKSKKARLVLSESHPKFYIAVVGVITGGIGLAFSIFLTIVYPIYWILLLL